MPEPLVRLSWTHLRISTWGLGVAPMVIVAVSPSTLMPLTSPLPDLEPQAARVRAAAVARPPAMTVRREMKEDMVVPFAGPGGPQ